MPYSAAMLRVKTHQTQNTYALILLGRWLAHWKREEVRSYRSVNELVSQLKMKRTTVVKCLHLLKEKGIVVEEKHLGGAPRKGPKQSIYRIDDDYLKRLQQEDQQPFDNVVCSIFECAEEGHIVLKLSEHDQLVLCVLYAHCLQGACVFDLSLMDIVKITGMSQSSVRRSLKVLKLKELIVESVPGRKKTEKILGYFKSAYVLNPLAHLRWDKGEIYKQYIYDPINKLAWIGLSRKHFKEDALTFDNLVSTRGIKQTVIDVARDFLEKELQVHLRDDQQSVDTEGMDHIRLRTCFLVHYCLSKRWFKFDSIDTIGPHRASIYEVLNIISKLFYVDPHAELESPSESLVSRIKGVEWLVSMHGELKTMLILGVYELLRIYLCHLPPGYDLTVGGDLALWSRSSDASSVSLYVAEVRS
jgi:DNA-binding transcriptional regulator GbsR (MarR family)